MSSLKYIPSLDGLRAIAVFLVIIHHWLPEESLINVLPNGMIGVTIFFVLSGFLISQILFSYKNKIDNQEISLKQALSTFYIRRSLRIFPIYYIFIIFLFFYGYRLIQDYFIYFITYTSNILFFLKDINSTVDHLWTLAVEEQFYIVWPFILFLVPQKHLKFTIFVLILVGLICQVVLNIYYIRADKLTFTAFDSFGIGSLIAYYNFYFKERLNSLNLYFILISVLILITILLNHFYSLSIPLSQRFVVSVLAGNLILNLIKDSQSMVFLLIKRILENKYLVSVGVISYGIYLYHTMTPGLMDNIYKSIDEDSLLLANIYFKFVINFIIVLIICKISWIFIEKPINSIKNRFQIK